MALFYHNYATLSTGTADRWLKGNHQHLTLSAMSDAVFEINLQYGKAAGPGIAPRLRRPRLSCRCTGRFRPRARESYLFKSR